LRCARFPGIGNATGNGDHFGDFAGLFQTHGFFDGDFIEGVHRHLDVGDIDAGTIGFHADLDVEVHHAFDWDQYFHNSALGK